MQSTKRLLIFILLIVFAYNYCISATHETFGTFKDWDYTPNQVYGQVKLADTKARQYYKISPLPNNAVKVEQFNEAGVRIGTRIVEFEHGLLSKITRQNQWGNTYQVQNFKAINSNQFSITQSNFGKNDLLPCKAKEYVYKNDMLAEVRYIGFDGRLCNCTNGFAIVKYKRYDDEKRFAFLKEESFFDEDDSPTVNKGWDCHKIVYEQDDHENELWSAYYNDQDQPVISRYGVHKVTGKYDADDNELEKQYIGLNGEVVPNVYGVAITRYQYTNGLQTKITFCDARNKIVKAADAGNGIAITKYEYDNRGNQVRMSYFDENDKPVNDHSGIQYMDDVYSDSSMLLSESYFDKDSMPVWDPEKVHRYVYQRDDKGRETALAYFDNNDAPKKDRTNVVYMIKYKYDSLQRVQSESFWEDDSTKMRRWNGYHGIAYKYNDQGQETQSEFFGKDGNLYIASGGYSKTTTIYDQSSRVSQYLRFNGDTPVIARGDGIDNYHSIAFTYDEKNRVSVINYADSLGHPINAHVWLAKGYDCSKIEIIYTGTRITSEKLYQVNSSYPYKTIDCLNNDYINTNGVNFGYKNR
jgi:hypothetical protein